MPTSTYPPSRPASCPQAPSLISASCCSSPTGCSRGCASLPVAPVAGSLCRAYSLSTFHTPSSTSLPASSHLSPPDRQSFGAARRACCALLSRRALAYVNSTSSRLAKHIKSTESRLAALPPTARCSSRIIPIHPPNRRADIAVPYMVKTLLLRLFLRPTATKTASKGLDRPA